MKSFFILLFLLYNSITLSAIKLHGEIIDAKTSKPLSFVNIGVKGTRYGTASNSSGRFVLNIPDGHKNGVLRFSCIGYEAKELPVSGFLQEKIVLLNPSITPLDEVVVMPDSTLRSFLLKAFRKIPDNYTATSSSLKGFYRANVRDSSNSDNLRFMEALIDSYKTSYGDKQDGTVKVLKTRKYISGDNFFPAYFYGGVHAVHYSDFVKNRSELLQGHKNYNYQLTGLKAYDNGKVYEIAFSPANGSGSTLAGKIYVDLESLAFVQINIEYTERGIKKRNTSLVVRTIKSVQKERTVVYGLHQGRYYLKSTRGSEKFKGKDEGRFVSTYEYITTNIHTENVSNIPFKEQVPITYTPAYEAVDYMESDWKDYNVLALPDVVNLVDTLEGNQLLNSRVERKRSFKKRLIGFMQNLESSIDVGWVGLRTPAGNYSLAHGLLNYEKERENKNGSLIQKIRYAYRFNNHFYATIESSESIDKEFYFKKYYLGGRLNLPLKTTGNRFLFCLNGGWSWGNMGVSLGEQTQENSFSFGGKKIKAEKIKAYTGLRQIGFEVGPELSYQISRRFHLEAGTSYLFPLVEKDIVLMEEKSGFFLFRKIAYEELSDEGIDYRINGVSSEKSRVNTNGWTFSFGLKMMF